MFMMKTTIFQQMIITDDMYNNAVDVGFTNIIVIDFAIESEIDKLLLSSAK